MAAKKTAKKSATHMEIADKIAKSKAKKSAAPKPVGAKLNPDAPASKRAGKKTEFKLPKTMAECADLAYELRERRLAIQREATLVGEQESKLREHIIQNLPKSKASGVSGKVANAKVETDVVPTFTDKPKFLAYVKKTGDFDLMTSGMNAKAIKDRWDNKKKIPGVGEHTIVKLSLTKVK